MAALDLISSALLGAIGGLILGLLIFIVSRRLPSNSNQAHLESSSSRINDALHPPKRSIERIIAQDVSLLVAKKLYEAIKAGEAEVKIVLQGCEGRTVFDFREMRLKCLTEDGIIMTPGEEKVDTIIEDSSFEQVVESALEETEEEQQ